MTVTREHLIKRARLEIGDNERFFFEDKVGDGITRAYDLPMKPVIAGTETVKVNDTVLTLDDDYMLDADGGQVVLNDPLGMDARLSVVGKAYWYFTDAKWEIFLDEAFNFHVSGREPFYLVDMHPIEAPLVALLTAAQAVWALVGSASGDIDISTPDGVFVPRTQRINYLTQLAVSLEERYAEKAKRLNIGMHRIEVFRMRRVSRSTGRLVPVFRSQEVDDPAPAERVYIPIHQGELPR